MKIPAYFCAAYRGPAGEDATEQRIEANVMRALGVASAIKTCFPSIELFVPHINQELLHRCWLKKYVRSPQIIEVCCEMAAEKRLILVLEPISAGMKEEIEYACCYPPKDVVYFDEWNIAAEDAIAQAIAKCKEY